MLCSTCQSPNPEGAPRCRSCGSPLASSSAAQNATVNADAPDALLPGTLLAGLYKIERVLGQGGFGITYACHDTLLQRSVAVKEFFPFGCRRDASQVLPSRAVSPQDFTSAREKFLDEARILAACAHRGIVAVHTAFSENNTAYMVMELLQGRTLGDVLAQRGGRLPEDETVTLAEAVCDALCYVHDRGLLHRDLKPENVMLCDDGRVMLIDFGTAREYSKGHLQVRGHTVVVTPGYAPLEQYAQQARRGPYTDIYALCALLYHLLTGQVPAAASDRAMGVLLSPVRELNPRVSKRVARAVETGLQIEVDKRPQSVGEFLDLLHREVEPETKSSSGWDEPLPLQSEAERIRREKQEQRSKNQAAVNLPDDEFIHRYLANGDAESSVPLGGIITDPVSLSQKFVVRDALQAQQELLNDATAQPQTASSASSSTQSSTQRPTLTPTPTAVGAGTSVSNPAAAALQASLLNAKPDPNSVPLNTPTVGAPTALQKPSSTPNAGGVAHRKAPIVDPDQERRTHRFFTGLAMVIFVFAVWLIFHAIKPRQSAPPPKIWRSPDDPNSSIPLGIMSQDEVEKQKLFREFEALREKEKATTSSGPFVSRPETVVLPHLSGALISSAFSPDGRVLAYSSQNGSIVLWDLEKRKTIRTLKTSGMHGLQFSPDGKFIVASLVTSATVWEIQSGKQLKNLPVASFGNSIYGLQFSSPNSIRLAVIQSADAAGESKISVVQWNWRTGKHQKFSTPVSINPNYYYVGLRSRHNRIAASKSNNSIFEFDWQKQKLVYSKQLTPQYPDLLQQDWQNTSVSWGMVNSIGFSHDGTWVAVAQNSNDLWLLDKKGNIKWQNFIPPLWQNLIHGTPPLLVFSPSQKWLIHDTGNLRIFETRSGKLLQYLSPGSHLTYTENASAFSPDEKRVYRINNGVLNIWRLKTTAQIKVQRQTVLGYQGKPTTPPMELSKAYESWKTAHATQNIEGIMSFYDKNAKFEGGFHGLTREGFQQLLQSNPQQNWRKVKDREKPLFYRNSPGYVLRAHLEYSQGWGIKQTHGERILLWKFNGANWVITSDTLGEYQDTVS